MDSTPLYSFINLFDGFYRPLFKAQDPTVCFNASVFVCVHASENTKRHCSECNLDKCLVCFGAGVQCKNSSCLSLMCSACFPIDANDSRCFCIKCNLTDGNLKSCGRLRCPNVAIGPEIQGSLPCSVSGCNKFLCEDEIDDQCRVCKRIYCSFHVEEDKQHRETVFCESECEESGSYCKDCLAKDLTLLVPCSICSQAQCKSCWSSDSNVCQACFEGQSKRPTTQEIQESILRKYAMDIQTVRTHFDNLPQGKKDGINLQAMLKQLDDQLPLGARLYLEQRKRQMDLARLPESEHQSYLQRRDQWILPFIENRLAQEKQRWIKDRTKIYQLRQ